MRNREGEEQKDLKPALPLATRSSNKDDIKITRVNTSTKNKLENIAKKVGISVSSLVKTEGFEHIINKYGPAYYEKPA